MRDRIPDQLSYDCGRVRLRRLAARDLVEFQRYRHDSQVGRYQGWSPVTDPEALVFLEEMQAALLFQPGKWCQVGIADVATDLLIGDIGINIAHDEQTAEIGFSLSRNSQGVGLAAEAVSGMIRLVFERTDVSRVCAITDSRNYPCIRLLERIGMRHVDTLEAQFRDAPCLEYVFEICRQ